MDPHKDSMKSRKGSINPYRIKYGEASRWDAPTLRITQADIKLTWVKSLDDAW